MSSSNLSTAGKKKKYLREYSQKNKGTKFQGFLRKELWQTFDQIKDQNDWKKPILHTFPQDIVADPSFPTLVSRCEAAVDYYHATPVSWQDNDDGSVTLLSMGLYLKEANNFLL